MQGEIGKAEQLREGTQGPFIEKEGVRGVNQAKLKVEQRRKAFDSGLERALRHISISLIIGRTLCNQRRSIKLAY